MFSPLLSEISTPKFYDVRPKGRKESQTKDPHPRAQFTRIIKVQPVIAHEIISCTFFQSLWGVSRMVSASSYKLGYFRAFTYSLSQLFGIETDADGKYGERGSKLMHPNILELFMNAGFVA